MDKNIKYAIAYIKREMRGCMGGKISILESATFKYYLSKQDIDIVITKINTWIEKKGLPDYFLYNTVEVKHFKGYMFGG